MTVSSAEKLLSNRGGVVTARDNYAAEQIDEIIDAAAFVGDTYNANVHGRAPVEALGAARCYFGTTEWWFRDGEDTNGVHVDAIQQKIDEYLADPVEGLFIVDMETWNVRTQTEMAISQHEIALSMWREQTDRTIGLYAIMPFDTVYTVTDLIKSGVDASSLNIRERAMAMLAREKHLNDIVRARLDPLVDFYAPRVYSYGDSDFAGYKYECSQQIVEALRIANGKPVYPVWWANALADGYPALSEANFLTMSKFVTSFPGIEGSILWDGAEEPAYWAGHVEDLISQEGEFAPPVPP